MQIDPLFLLSSAPELLKGLEFTLWLVLSSLAIGIVIGLCVCFGKMYAHGMLQKICVVYVVVARGIPEIVVMFWVYYCCPLVFSARPSGFWSAAIAMALYSGAMLAELFRAGIQSVPSGQHQAAKALGLPSLWLWLEIIGPQALRTMIPALLGLLSLQIKVSGMASAIGVGELVYRTTILAGQNFRYFELYTTAGLIYFVVIFSLSAMARSYEQRLKGASI